MSELNYEELILLDNFIYLRWESEKNALIIDIVNEILKDNNLDKLINKEENCIVKMPAEEWIDTLEKMKTDISFREKVKSLLDALLDNKIDPPEHCIRWQTLDDIE